MDRKTCRMVIRRSGWGDKRGFTSRKVMLSESRTVLGASPHKRLPLAVADHGWVGIRWKRQFALNEARDSADMSRPSRPRGLFVDPHADMFTYAVGLHGFGISLNGLGLIAKSLDSRHSRLPLGLLP
jgi:hypothetical protein